MYTSILSKAALSLALCQTVLSAGDSAWRSRSIYQVVTDRFARTDGSTTASCDTGDQTYCGGSWKGIENNLDYIQDMGFDAVWISPITAQIQGNSPAGEAYHGYWQTNLYYLNSAFGTQDDLKSLASALHARGMYLMVDIVVNHNGWIGSHTDIDWTTFYPFSSESDYHSYCLIDYNDETSIKDCWLGDDQVPLPDLRTENSNVVEGYSKWIGELVSNYSIDGLRMDTAMQVDTAFWSSFVEAAGVYVLGEVNEGDSSYVCGYQSYLPGVFNYASYFTLISAFQSTSGSISDLVSTMDSTASDCGDMSLLGTFSENHDQPRFAALNSDMAAATNVIAWTLLTDGIPVIYQGQEQHYNAEGGSSVPYNREALWFSDYNTGASLYTVTASLNKARKAAIADDGSYLTTLNKIISHDSNHIAMKKGKMSVILTNAGSGAGDSTYTMKAGYAANTKLTEVLTCKTLTADGSGNINAPMSAGQPRIYLPTSAVSGGLCGSSSKSKPRNVHGPRD
ncbi:glycoside hydrolase family 13 protein [Polychaeton citri CBS 116435]|uniref:alpha-amylase n=1 Tax=Polychaeton citri CBS 116435 TaxID=1314669 RepID=A0A9P4QFF3_9PEZI|nr:glycoside hydrolase family 13 protein [Polychaeton citri CBS 116435]